MPVKDVTETEPMFAGRSVTRDPLTEDNTSLELIVRS
jgi:hypothetical protein